MENISIKRQVRLGRRKPRRVRAYSVKQFHITPSVCFFTVDKTIRKNIKRLVYALGIEINWGYWGIVLYTSKQYNK